MKTGTEIRRGVLDSVAACVCRDRQNTYGDAEDNFAVIAEFHSTYLRTRGLLAKDAKLEPYDVAAMATLMKIARAAHNPMHEDSWVDGAGYQVCGAGIIRRLIALLEADVAVAKDPLKFAAGPAFVSGMQVADFGIVNSTNPPSATITPA